LRQANSGRLGVTAPKISGGSMTLKNNKRVDCYNSLPIEYTNPTIE